MEELTVSVNVEKDESKPLETIAETVAETAQSAAIQTVTLEAIQTQLSTLSQSVGQVSLTLTQVQVQITSLSELIVMVEALGVLLEDRKARERESSLSQERREDTLEAVSVTSMAVEPPPVAKESQGKGFLGILRAGLLSQ